MKKYFFITSVIAVIGMLAGACAPAPANQETMSVTEEMMGETQSATEEMMKDENVGVMTEEAEATTEMTDLSAVAPEWFGASLVNVSTGEEFTIHDYQGKVILVETLAMWCPTCRRQQEEVKTLIEMLGERDDFVSIGLDIDPNEDGFDLKDYIDTNGFDWIYAVAPVAVYREVGELYGELFLNPPSTPMLVIDRHGEAHALPFGLKSADDLYEALQPFLSEGM